jgi:spoIIIJ-associated protein
MTLKSIQYLTRVIVQRKYEAMPGLMVDVSGYRMRRENFLCKKATAIARIVLETGREMALDQLNDREFESVEKALATLPDVKIYPVGSGIRKTIIIAPIKVITQN